MSSVFHVMPLGDSALLLELGDRIDEKLNEHAVAMARALESAGIRGVRDVVPTFKSVAVYFDPGATDTPSLIARIQAEAKRAEALNGGSDQPKIDEAILKVPVCYGGEWGPDLAEVARLAGTDESEAVALHAARIYRVFMLGFLPGFPYMASVDPRIAAPRHSSPRVQVRAGSVGIAGSQTGIYPQDSPGGWCIIGRTPLEPYSAVRSEPFLFKPGGRVKFEAISRAQFDVWDRSR